MKLSRIVIAGTSSGVGKTVISCGIIRALRDAGLTVQPFKVGPDYIDPGYLAAAAKSDVYNLDAWIMGEDRILGRLLDSRSDVAVIEGVMGMYDGADGGSDFASTYHVASLTKSPVILVLDASKSARSIAAAALGFQKFQKNSRIRGVILNRVASERHERLCREALDIIGMRVFGAIYRNPALELESRHLGLIPAGKGMQKRLGAAARLVADSIDADALLGMLAETASIRDVPQSRRLPPPKRTRAAVAVALDESFSFYYQDNIAALAREGATVEFFSPIRDAKLPDCDGIYIGGGFPEVLAEELAKNRPMMAHIKKCAESGMPVYAECGGLMYLTKSIRYGNKKHRMAGVFDAGTKMTKKATLGYTSGRTSRRSVIAGRSHAFRGHEFHYSELDCVPPDARFAYKLETGAGIKNGADGLVSHNTLASYGHLYFDSSNHAETFVGSCAAFSRR